MAEQCRFIALCVFLSSFSSSSSSGISDASPRLSFLLAVPRELNLDTSQVVITTTSIQPAIVKVTAPARPNFPRTLSVTKDRVSSFLVKDSVMQKSSLYQDKGILVTSDTPIDVILLNIAYSPQSIGAFLALPVDQLSTWYVAVTSCVRGECMIVVVSPHNENKVTVMLAAYKGSNTSSITFKNTTYQNGDQIIEELQDYDAFQLLGEETDLTGTTVTSSKPVAVISGGMRDFQDDYQNYDTVVEQLPPIASLGDHYVLGGFPTTLGQYFRVHVAFAYPNTKLAYSDQDGAIIRRSDERGCILDFSTTRTAILTSNQPILVMLQNPYNTDTRDSNGAFIVAMPTQNWAFSFNSTATVFVSSESYIILTTYTDCAEPFQVDIQGNHREENVLTWTTQGNYKASYIALPSNNIFMYSVYIYNCACPFGGYFLTQETTQTWAFPLGWSNKRSQWMHSTNSSNVTDFNCIDGALERTTEENKSPQYAESTFAPIVTDTTIPDSSQSQTTANKVSYGIESQSSQSPFSTAPTHVPITQSANGVNTETCLCSCHHKSLSITNLTDSDLDEIILKIVQHLQVNEEELSATIRKKTSSFDYRQSSRYISVSIATFTIIFVSAFVILPDISSLLRFLIRRGKFG